jgi:hypothetical protein
VDIAYPPTFPFDPLDVRPVKPAVRRLRHQIGRSGDLCVLQEEMEPWLLGNGIARIIPAIEAWWRGVITGVFENEVHAAELLSYLDETSIAVHPVLIPAHAQRVPAGALWGRFELELAGATRGPGIVGHLGPELRPIVGCLEDVNARIWKSLRRARTGRAIGMWIALDEEPEPFHNFEMFLQVISSYLNWPVEQFEDRIKRIITPATRQRGWMPLALNYPSRPVPATISGNGSTGREWLFLSLEWPSPRPDRRARRGPGQPVWPQAALRGLRSHSVALPDLQRRTGAVYPSAALGSKHVLIVGAGSLGSTVARSLVAGGLGKVGLCEPDLMQPGNTVRHELRMPDVGRPKNDALAQVLRETNPYVEVYTIASSRASDRKLESMIRDPATRPDLIVVTVGMGAVDGQVDALARSVSPPIPVVHGWVMEQAQVLRGFVHFPGRTACTWCTGLYEEGATNSGTGPFLPGPKAAAPAEPFFEASCTSPAYPGSGNANALAAHVLGELVLDVLHGRITDQTSSWIFAGNRVHEIDPAYPVAPLTVEKRGARPHPDCPVCSAASVQALDAGLTPAQQAVYDRALAELGGAA